MTIRQETPADIKAIHCVHQAAFAREEEAQLVDRLRQNVAVFVSELSLVAIDGDDLVGHVLLSRVHVVEDSDTHESLAMAPVAVRPDKQGRGIGSALIKSALYQARHLGFSSVIVLGHPGYYPRFGFLPARRWHITPPFDVPSDAFMAIELYHEALNFVHGTVVYPVEFDAV